jgi:hypothetical protein
MARITYNHPKIEVPNRDWNGCLLVNPLCPDDLCWLPLNEDGSQHDLHCLGTMPWDQRLRLTGRDIMFMSTSSALPEQLYLEGWMVQLKTFTAEAEFQRLVNPELYYMVFPDG